MFHGIIVLKLYLFAATGISLIGLFLLVYFSYRRKQREKLFEGEEVIHRKIDIVGIGQVECDYHVRTYLLRGKWRRETWFEAIDGWKFRYFDGDWFSCAAGTTEWIKVEDRVEVYGKLRGFSTCRKDKKSDS